MDMWIKVLIAVLVVFLIGFPLLGRVVAGSRTSELAENVAAAPPVQEKTPAPKPGAPKPEKKTPAVETAGLNAKTIVGTRWLIDGTYEVTFMRGGKVSVAGAIPGIPVSGKWRINGNTLTASAMGQNISLQLDGDSIHIDGATVERLR
jgi:hypothetical protein